MSLSISKRLDKDSTPFQCNGANNYYWLRQGKKHYWGIKGKDYGFIDSTRPILKSVKIDELKSQHLKYQLQHDYRSINHSNRFDTNPIYKNDSSQPYSYKQKEPRYSSVNADHHYRYKTEPMTMQNQQASIANQIEKKKKRLSILSQNVQFERFPKMQYKPSDKSENKRVLPDRNYHIRTQSQSNNYDELDQYRERIVKVVHKDRRNSPTYCNSLAYPLPCYRYVQ